MTAQASGNLVTVGQENLAARKDIAFLTFDRAINLGHQHILTLH
ncbi:hypothetical protein CES86_5318 [Brucella lupini]|uniref:Uncharacterized protein n=1 Tax=Brucella lupini TaxID=255457 RepID=A0A256H1B9_9HYPH|nr:hypothetical protein CES86_5318 [Brucella lupini]